MSHTETVTATTGDLHTALEDFAQLLDGLADGHLHLADPEGGWTVAQIVSHVQVSGQLWVAVLHRLALTDDDPLFVYREEVGHDVVGAPPPYGREAAGRVRSTLRAVVAAMEAATDDLWERRLELPPFGVLRAIDLNGGIAGHLVAHAEQAKAILRTRGVLPS